MESLASEAESRAAEESPQAMAGLMRKFYERTGLKLGDGVEEAIRRMEAGEDPDQVEADLGDLLEAEQDADSPAEPGRPKRLVRKLLPPNVDPELYDL